MKTVTSHNFIYRNNCCLIRKLLTILYEEALTYYLMLGIIKYLLVQVFNINMEN